MSGATPRFILAASQEHVEPSLDHLSSDDARRAARFWAGKHTGSQAKAACVERIRAAWRDPKRIAKAMAALRPDERAVLAVVKRFGGQISGTLLLQELRARGIMKEPTREERLSYHRAADPIRELCERLILVGGARDYSSFGYEREYSSVALPQRVASNVDAAAPLGWKAAAPTAKPPESTHLRAPAQMVVDLEQTAGALRTMGAWKVNQGGALSAAARNRLAKLIPTSSSDPLEPPDRVALDYSLLGALGAIELDGPDGRVVVDRAERLFHLPTLEQASSWVRAWMTLRLWQDGIGSVPDRDSRDESTRIDPSSLSKARQLLVWALTRVAHGDGAWLDLETFLLDLYAATGESGLSFYWNGYAWHPRFAAAIDKDKLPAGVERARAFWMDDEAIWAANALLSTFVHLGVVERGRSGGSRSERWSFRLTDLGKAVFGAPEIQLEKKALDGRCLAIQPNHEVLLYLDCADGPAITTLGHLAARQSSTGIVQTFKLTRDSIYGALEGGMTPTAIESFLTERSRTGIPPNVSQSLAEWSRKREALVVRREVAFGLGLPHGQQAIRGRTEGLGAQCVVASSKAAAKGAEELGITVEPETPFRDWMVDEHGVVSLGKSLSLVGRARLQRFARFAGALWQITAESVGAARALGVSADQILEWLAAHLSHEVPAVLASAIRNWAGGRGRAFLGEVVLLQVDDPRAFDALRQSERFQPLLRGLLASGSLVVPADQRDEAADLLRELGFSLDAECKVAPARQKLDLHDTVEQTISLVRLASAGRIPRRRSRR